MKETLMQRRKDAKLQRDDKITLRYFFTFGSLRFCAIALTFFVPVAAQNVAILAPDKLESSKSFAEKLQGALAKKIRILDNAMSEAAFNSAKAANPFNLTTEGSKALGAAIGCDHFILVKSATLRRSSSKRPEYYESHAAIFGVSARTGRLIYWRLLRFEESKPEAAQNILNDAVGQLAADIENKLRLAANVELAEPPIPEMEEPPDEGSPEAKNFRAPVPYRRIKPEYTPDGFLNDIEATVEIVVDLNKDGTILRTEIVRWAGYGLDESVEKVVRSMNWRPAERSGKPLPMRFLLRYNFKKIEKG
jgi:hypothetical protein